jgi:hypothetical protein
MFEKELVCLVGAGIGDNWNGDGVFGKGRYW